MFFERLIRILTDQKFLHEISTLLFIKNNRSIQSLRNLGCRYNYYFSEIILD